MATPEDCPIVASDLLDRTANTEVLDKINELELKIEASSEALRHELFWAAVKFMGIAVPIFAAIMLWVWGVIRDQASLNGELKARMDATEAAFDTNKISQARIESRLDEISRTIREDSRELRDALTRHLDGVRLEGEK